jgi:hypothetical protein
LMLSASATDDPPYFWTTMLTWVLLLEAGTPEFIGGSERPGGAPRGEICAAVARARRILPCDDAFA